MRKPARGGLLLERDSEGGRARRASFQFVRLMPRRIGGRLARDDARSSPAQLVSADLNDVWLRGCARAAHGGLMASLRWIL